VENKEGDGSEFVVLLAA